MEGEKDFGTPFKILRLVTILGPWDGCLSNSEVSKRLTEILQRVWPPYPKLTKKRLEQLYSNIEQKKRKFSSEICPRAEVTPLTTQFPRLNVVGWLGFYTWLSIVMDAWRSGHVLEAEYSRVTGTPTIFINAFYDDTLDKLCYVSGIGLRFGDTRNTIKKLARKDIGLISPERLVNAGPKPRKVYGTGMLRDFAGTLFVRMLVERSLYCSCLCRSEICMKNLGIKDKGLEELVCDRRSLSILSRCLQVALHVLLEQFIARSRVMDLISG